MFAKGYIQSKGSFSDKIAMVYGKSAHLIVWILLAQLWCGLARAAWSDCPSAYLRFIFEQGKEESGRTGGFDSFAFHRSAYRKAQAILKKTYDSDARKVIDVFAQARKIGGEYTIRFDVIDASGARRRVSGIVNGTPMAQVIDPELATLFLFSKEPGEKFQRFRAKDIDPKSIEIKRDPIPQRLLKEPMLSRVAQEAGIVSLTHKIRAQPDMPSPVERLVSILKAGQMDARQASGRDPLDPKGSNFFELKTAQTRKALPHIEFDPTVLNRKDFYINQGWDYGRYTKDSIRFDEKDRIRKFLHAFGTYGGTSPHEVVVWGPLSTSQILKIKLSPEMREELLRRLKEEGVRPPAGKTWEEILTDADGPGEPLTRSSSPVPGP